MKNASKKLAKLVFWKVKTTVEKLSSWLTAINATGFSDKDFKELF